ncbi:hypothetical protein [Spirillospora sp. CA-294931]|uniref:hypothetical protein n=1 Tax=Spirillospora sp. CA-294931 TaxID=3240042 RepID=UPI003D90C8CA
MANRPFTVNAAAALEGLEGAAALGFGLFVGWETVSGSAVDETTAIAVTALALLGGLGMLHCARGLLRAEPWSRAPTVLTQLFALPVAWSLWQSEQHFIAVPLGLVAAATLVVTLSGPSTAWLVHTAEDDDEDDAGPDGENRAEEPAEDGKNRDDAGSERPAP